MDATKKEFFSKYKWLAIWNHILYGVPASITLAQAGVEGNYGKSWLFRVAKNSFGIKAYSNPDNLPVVYADDDTAGEPFRKYDTINQSFKDHSKFLIENKRYADLFNSNNVYSWAYGLQNKGYATSPTYANALLGDINTYDLQKNDFWGNNKPLLIILGIVLILGICFLIYKLIKRIQKNNLNKK